jgi:hypothetical protein
MSVRRYRVLTIPARSVLGSRSDIANLFLRGTKGAAAVVALTAPKKTPA